MNISPIDELQERLNVARGGGAILFCGAGFSADCLNFNPDQTLGTGAQLLGLFNTELDQNPPFKDLRNAADALWDKVADNGMEKILKERFNVSNVTADMVELLHYPWKTVYTTNYDNALEIAARAAHKPATGLNNTDDPSASTRELEIIHLHGYIEKWDIHNIRESCVLGTDSYWKLTHVKNWLSRFRKDIDQAPIVVFVGFNAGDFHLNHAINDLTGLREKAFFINRPAAQADPDVAAAQRRLGIPLFTGRAGLAETIREILAKDAPTHPSLASFEQYTPPNSADTVPTQPEIEDLFLFGSINTSHLARDLSGNVSEYHVTRTAMQDALSAIVDGTRIFLIEGHTCDGKTLLIADLAFRLSGARPVYQMRQAYEDILNEVAAILHHAPNAAMIIENCFDLPAERLASIARQFDGQDGLLILTSRAVAVDASPAGLSTLEGSDSFRRIPLARLDDREAQVLSDLADQIAGWRDFKNLNPATRLRFIQNTCDASLPNFLMKLLRSEYVVNRYREEFNKLSLSPEERTAIIIALYVTHIGENAPVSFLSNAMETDYGAIIDRINARAGNDSFRLVRRTGAMIQTVPSIGAQNILQNLFGDAEIVNAIVPTLKVLSEVYRDPFEQRMYNQMMRFSILSDVVTDMHEINQFFEHNKREPQIRRMPLFWLQWHMAKCAEGDLTRAESHLEQGYREAEEFERRTGRSFDQRQLNDRRAKFLMLRAKKNGRTGIDLFRDFDEAIKQTDRILRQDDPQHYPFETLAEIVSSYRLVGHRLDAAHKDIIANWLQNLTSYAQKRAGVVSSGYQRERAQMALGRA